MAVLSLFYGIIITMGIFANLFSNQKTLNWEFKTIHYRGGLISFDIPKKWIEENEESGGGTYYDNSPNSGTLRVNVGTVQHENKSKNPSETFTKEKLKTKELKKTILGNGDQLFEWNNKYVESNTQITMYSFACIHKTKQMDYLIAIFTWTITSNFENKVDYIKELNMIRENVHKMKFGR